jgi:succinate-semialdehyde dehydrogenase/glutarate-semialdehyde dehydrogenase
MYQVIDPATGEHVASYPTATDEQVEDALARVHRGFGDWRTRPVTERAVVLHRAADLFEERAEELAALITTEMGKPTPEALGELGIVVDIFRYYADRAEELTRPEPLTVRGGDAAVEKHPVGALLGIMPWNFPYYQVARFAAPNLALGNTVLLKHAPCCPSSAAAIEALLREAGLPADAYVNLYATNEQVSRIIADPRVQGVSLTGSDRAGAAVAEQAGRHLKKVVLELGGSDPMVVLDSADVKRTARVAARSRTANMGQACNAPKRMIVASELYDDFVAALCQEMDGEPGAPLSSVEAAERLVGQVERAVDQGATVLTGGGRVDRPGAWVQPTVLVGVTPGMDAHHEELFGPVAVVYRVDGEDEAVALANDTPYGLGASVFSQDPERARRVGARIDAGMVFVNQAGGSQADVPFGGVKRSGVGRELGDLGIEEFMNKKVVLVPGR